MIRVKELKERILRKLFGIRELDLDKLQPYTVKYNIICKS
jgi:hypothetical protein